MNSPFVVSRQIARAIEFKEYLINRDYRSRRVVIDFFIDWLLPRNDMADVLAWFQILRTMYATESYPTNHPCWDDLLLIHSKQPAFMEMVRQFTGKGV
jgi:hypothetical protein